MRSIAIFLPGCRNSFAHEWAPSQAHVGQYGVTAKKVWAEFFSLTRIFCSGCRRSRKKRANESCAGSGRSIGALTRAEVNSAKKRNLVRWMTVLPILRRVPGDAPNITLIHGDVLGKIRHYFSTICRIKSCQCLITTAGAILKHL